MKDLCFQMKEDTDDYDYGLEYSEESTSEPDVDLENQYYHGKAMKREDPKAAMAVFQTVIDLQGAVKGEWGFKALKQIIKINFKLKNYQETFVKYNEMLSYVKDVVTKNHGEKSINSILDFTSTIDDVDILEKFYETTLEMLKSSQNQRLWFKTNTKLGNIFLERKEFEKVDGIVRQLYQCCGCQKEGEEEKEDINLISGTQLLEIYALEIQMHTELKNYKEMKELYDRSLEIRSAIPHPYIMSIIRECGGKMHLRAGEYDKAYTDFFEAFRDYEDSGNSRRTTCLKYLILTSMLMNSSINPFDSQEAKPYQFDPDVEPMTNLITAYQNNDMKQFENNIRQNKETLLKDPFIKENIEILLKNVRIQVLKTLIIPYRKITLSYIGQELNITDEEAEHIVVSCILDGIITGKIDQVNQVFIKTNEKNENEQINFLLMRKAIEHIDKIQEAIIK